MASLNKNTPMGRSSRAAMQDETSVSADPSATNATDENPPVDEQEPTEEPGED